MTQTKTNSPQAMIHKTVFTNLTADNVRLSDHCEAVHVRLQLQVTDILFRLCELLAPRIVSGQA